MKRLRPTILQKSNQGFTLIEIAFVLVILGFILSMSTTAWMSVKQGQEYSKLRSQLVILSQCLANQVLLTKKIPTESEFSSCADEIGNDIWNRPFRYLCDHKGAELDKDLTTRNYTDESGIHPDALWVVYSIGKNGQDTTAPSWNCSSDSTNHENDNFCYMVTKNDIYYELNQN